MWTATWQASYLILSNEECIVKPDTPDMGTASMSYYPDFSINNGLDDPTQLN